MRRARWQGKRRIQQYIFSLWPALYCLLVGVISGAKRGIALYAVHRGAARRWSIKRDKRQIPPTPLPLPSTNTIVAPNCKRWSSPPSTIPIGGAKLQKTARSSHTHTHRLKNTHTHRLKQHTHTHTHTHTHSSALARCP